MGRFVIAAYRPKPGKDPNLLAVLKKHMQVLRTEQLVTDRPAYVMRAKDGTIVEVFEWRSDEAVKQAHENEAVKALWGEFEAACDYVPLSSLAEVSEMFPNFDALDV